MQVLYPRCARLDVHKDMVMARVRYVRLLRARPHRFSASSLLRGAFADETIRGGRDPISPVLSFFLRRPEAYRSQPRDTWPCPRPRSTKTSAGISCGSRAPGVERRYVARTVVLHRAGRSGTERRERCCCGEREGCMQTNPLMVWKAASDTLAFKPYWGRPAVRDLRGDDGDAEDWRCRGMCGRRRLAGSPSSRWAKKGTEGGMLTGALFPFPDEPPPQKQLEQRIRLRKDAESGDLDD